MPEYSKFNLIFRIKRNLYRWPMGKILYAALPFLLIGLMYAFIYGDGVLFPGDRELLFSFIEDRSNSIAIPYLMVLLYFLCGSYLDFSCRTFRDFAAQNQIAPSECGIALKIPHLLSLSGFGGGLFFVWIAAQNEIFWSNQIAVFPTGAMYLFCLGMTWYTALITGVTEICVCYKYHKVLCSGRFALDLDSKAGVKALHNSIIVLAGNIIIGIYIALGASIIISTDIITHHDLAFNNAFVRFVVLIGLVVLAIIIVAMIAVYPLLALYRMMRDKKNERLMEVKNEMSQALRDDDLEKMRKCLTMKQVVEETATPFFGSASTQISIAISIIIPVMGILLQIISLMQNVQKA